MTEKQERILQAALSLFAGEGFNSTSTSKVAKLAGVSEGLIFRHFGNKEGLLKAILELGEETAKKLFADVLFAPDAAAAVRKAIELPFTVYRNEDERQFWRLQYKLKWELEYNMKDKLVALTNGLTASFKELGYSDPELEAEFLVQTIDALGAALLKGGLSNPDEMERFLKRRYKV